MPFTVTGDGVVMGRNKLIFYMTYPLNKLVFRDGKGFIDFLHNGKLIYWIEEKDILSNRELEKWLNHLQTKRWVEKQHLVELVKIQNELEAKSNTKS